MLIAVSVKYLCVKMELNKFVLNDACVNFISVKTVCVDCGKC